MSLKLPQNSCDERVGGVDGVSVSSDDDVKLYIGICVWLENAKEFWLEFFKGLAI